MINNNFDPNQPIILGLAGKAATGKTSVAEFIVPKAQINASSNNIIWDHIFFALPLYEMASVRKQIKGLREKDRQLYSLYNILYDLFGGSPIGNVPDWEELVRLTKDIYSLEIEPEDIKPRTFLQKVGDLCRAIDEDCFARWAIAKSNKLFRSYLKDESLFHESNPFCVIISDVRFMNEAEWILKQQNGIVVCFDASDDVRSSRMLKRDGAVMTAEQSAHKSEREIDLVKQMATKIIDTNNLTIEQQAQATISVINEVMGAYA
jgi:dephospho-CoA kinase